jgi:hypothetical protein
MFYIVFCGALLGALTLKLKNEFEKKNYDQVHHIRKRSILIDIYEDLVHLFHFQKSGKFIGPLEPLNDVNILKNLVMVEDEESFTINKKVIHLCTKDPQNGTYYDKNTLMFVVLHELAHVLCSDVGHTDQFSIINQALLDHAIRRKFYDPSRPFVENYCKLK